MNWERFYATYPLGIGRTDYLAQVGHTVGGKQIPEKHFRCMVSRIKELLDLQSSDVVLDLCCGNGLITQELATVAERVVGVDFSEPLLDVATRDHQPENVFYQRANVLDLTRTPLRDGPKFTKILMYAALQHFKEPDLGSVLESILQVSAEKRVILFGFVPDRCRKWSFYDSPKRKLAHFIHRASRSDRLGTWWRQGYIHATCEKIDLHCSFHDLHPALHASKYRFDVRME